MPIQKPHDPKRDPKPAPPKDLGFKPPERKPWKKKTPVEVVLEQGEKLKEEIAEMEEEIQIKRRQLEKFEQARKLFENL